MTQYQLMDEMRNRAIRLIGNGHYQAAIDLLEAVLALEALKGE